MRYVLMNKDKEITDFEVITEYSSVYKVFDVKDCSRKKLPYGFKLKEGGDLGNGLSLWLSNRNGAEHNHIADGIICHMGLYNHDTFIRSTHAASLNDTFWVKAKDEKVSWKDVSLYDKDFNELIGKAGLGLIDPYHDIIEKGKVNSKKVPIIHAPELLHPGSFGRMFKHEKDGIYLYKADGNVKNVWSEMMATEISDIINPSHSLPYTKEKLYGRNVSKCKIFTDESTGLVTPYAVFNGKLPSKEEVLAFCREHGFEEDYRRMLIFDALIFNTDRHLNNYGFLIDNDTLKIKGFAPYYDQNLCLFGGVGEDAFKTPDRVVYYRQPRFEDDFTALGQEMMTDEIAKDVEKLTDFSFKFRGDEDFPEWLVEGTEKIIRMQAKALLDKTLTSKTAFVIDKTDEEKLKEQYQRAVFRANTIKRLVIGSDTAGYLALLKEDPQNNHVSLEIRDRDNTGTVTVDMMNLTMIATGKQFEQAFTDKISRLLDTFSQKND